MSFLNGLWNRAPQQQQGQQPMQQPQGTQPPQGQQNPSGGPATQQDPKSPPNPTAALDQFMGLMVPKNTDQKSDQGQPEPFTVFGKVDPKAIDEQVSQASFTNGLDPELAQKALGGDQQALLSLLNGVAQNVFKTNMQLSQKFVEHGANRGYERVTGELDSHFRKYELKNQNVSTQNPALQHPVGKAMVQTFAQQIANANPSMSPSEVQKQAEQGVLDFMKIGGTAQDSQNQPGSNGQSGGKETNWLNYLD